MRGRPGCPTGQKKNSVGATGGSPLFLLLQGKVGYQIAPSSDPASPAHLPPEGKALGVGASLPDYNTHLPQPAQLGGGPLRALVHGPQARQKRRSPPCRAPQPEKVGPGRKNLFLPGVLSLWLSSKESRAPARGRAGNHLAGANLRRSKQDHLSMPEDPRRAGGPPGRQPSPPSLPAGRDYLFPALFGIIGGINPTFRGDLPMKQLVIGVLAHVDAGKTTLSEALLYTAGAIPTLGRVDHRDAYLDTHDLERARGITIFSKQALFRTEGMAVTLLDTPGHVDFSTEMERTLQVLDYAILVISATDGVQAHTETLWRLLRRNHIPTFLFVTKMDLPNPGREAPSRRPAEGAGRGLPGLHHPGPDLGRGRGPPGGGGAGALPGARGPSPPGTCPASSAWGRSPRCSSAPPSIWRGWRPSSRGWRPSPRPRPTGRPSPPGSSRSPGTTRATA